MSLPLLWFLLGLAFLAVELVNPAMVLIFFGIGAWLTACAALAGLALAGQAVLFIAASLLALRLLRGRFRHIFGGRAEAASNAHDYGGQGTTPPPHPLSGREGVVSKPIRPGHWGEVRIDGSFWRAVTDTPGLVVDAGSTVRVLGGSPGDALLLRVVPAGDGASAERA